MIKLNQIHKIYHQNKRKQVNALNDVSITFESQGLMMLLGTSGSGKTTLLNVIGGLDKASRGTITFADQTLSSRQTKQWDLIRNQDVGYIFQNYYLLPHETVYENIAITLRMVGVKSPEVIDQRITQLLSTIGMVQYKKRLASQLSGGQMQRVAIARALAKNPSVIIADEPTGNLDSKNTLEIMRLIRRIAKDKLVIMVTHEQRLASLYADRIIQLEDGKIIRDYLNETPDTEALVIDSEIYLKDMVTKELSNAPHTVTLFQDQETDQPIKARLIIKNNALYIDIDKTVFDYVHLLDQQSEIQVFNDHRDNQVQSEARTLNLENIMAFEVPKSKRTHQVLSIKEALKMSIHKIKESSRFSKFLYLGLALSASVIALAIGLLMNIVFIDQADVIVLPENTQTIRFNEISNYDDYREIAGLTSLSGTRFNIPMNVTITTPAFYQTSNTIDLRTSIVPDAMIDASDLAYGRMPENAFEIVIDGLLVDRILSNTQFQAMGFNQAENFLGLSHRPKDIDISYAIVGITYPKAPVFYGSQAHAYGYTFDDYLPLELHQENIEVKQGRMISASNEVLVPESNNGELFEAYFEIYQGTVYHVVGTYQLMVDGQQLSSRRILIHLETIKENLFLTQKAQNQDLYLFTKNPEQLHAELSALGLIAEDVLQRDMQAERSERIRASSGLIVFTMIAITASSLSFYFMIRSSLIQRIYDIGVYRSLGVSKLDILKMFLIESILLTTMTSLIGFLFMSYMLSQIQDAAQTIINVVHVSGLTILIGLVFIYFMNGVSSIIPIAFLLRKTPAEINNQYDL